MTQYSSPYSTPQVYPGGYDPFAAYLAPARRAGLLMIILGSLVAAYGLCNGVVVWIAPEDQLVSQHRLLGGGRDAPELPIHTLRILAAVASVFMLAIGLTFVALGVPVRRGSNGAAITGMVLTGLLMAGGAILLLISLIAALASPILFLSVCVVAVPMVLLVLQLVWLIQASRAISQVKAMQMQYQAQYWQYLQQQQMYAQQAYNPQPPQPPGGDGGPNAPPSQG